MTVSSNIKSTLSDVDGMLSSKRVIAFLAFFVLATGYLANTFGPYRVDQKLNDGMMFIEIGCLFGIGAEKFAPGRPLSNKTDNPENVG